MAEFNAGVTPAGKGLDGIVWNILGQTYVPKSHCASSFSWDATFPPGTFVPPHTHPDQDEFILVHEGTFDLMLDGAPHKAGAGDTILLPRGIVHGIFNNGDQAVRCHFWVSPTQKLFDLFTKIHNVDDPARVVAIAAEHNIHFAPPPGEG